MDIEAIATIIDKMLTDLIDAKIYPYSAKRRFGIGDKVASGSLRASIMVVPTLLLYLQVNSYHTNRNKTPQISDLLVHLLFLNHY